MNYNISNEEEILKDIAGKIEKLRISKQIKESEIEERSGISRKTLYNFKKGSTGISMKNFIRLLKALDEIDRLSLMFPEKISYSPMNQEVREMPKRVRDKKKTTRKFKWGDEE